MKMDLVKSGATSAVSLVTVCLVTYFVASNPQTVFSNKMLMASQFFLWVSSIGFYVLGMTRFLRLFFGDAVNDKKPSQNVEKFEFTLIGGMVIYGDYVSMPYE